MEGFKLQIDDVLTAQQLEALILKLSLRRALMSPAVPVEVPEHGIPTVRAASFSIDVAPEGLTINLRSTGLGWLGYQLNLAGTLGLRDTLNAYFPSAVFPNPVAPK